MWFLRSLFCYTIFSWCWKIEEKTKNICECHTKILVCTTYRLNISKKSHRSSQSCNFGKILQYWKNLGMLQSSRFWNEIFETTTSQTYLPPCVLKQGRHYQIQGWRNFQPKFAQPPKQVHRSSRWHMKDKSHSYLF